MHEQVSVASPSSASVRNGRASPAPTSLGVEATDHAPFEDALFDTAWRYLTAVLSDLGRPAVLDRRGHRPVPGREVPPPTPGDCIVFLSHPEGRWGVTLAAGRVLPPGSVVWAICPGWLSREGNRLLVHRGLWADASGQLFLDDFVPPRVATYYANLMSGPDTYGERDDGDAFEPGLACPMSSSTELSWGLGCKVTTRALAAGAGARVPWSLALFPQGRPAHLHDLEARTGGRVVGIDVSGALLRVGADLDAPNREAMGEDALHDLTDALERAMAPLLARWPSEVIRLVVKPSGPFHMLARGVRLLPERSARDAALAAARLLLGLAEVPIRPGDSVLIDAFGGGPQRTMRVRAVVARVGEHPVRARTQALMAGIGPSIKPISGVTAFPQGVLPALRSLGIADVESVGAALIADLTEQGEATLRAIVAAEVAVPGKPHAQTDLIGLDFVIALPGDVAPGQVPLAPVLIEVNNHDCTDLTQIFGFTQLDHRGVDLSSPNAGLLDEYLRALAQRSQAQRVGGKTVLVVGGVTESKRVAWESARRHGVRIVLADDRLPKPGSGPGAEVVAHVIVPGLNDDHTVAGDARHADSIVAEVRGQGLRIDGVLTFCEDNAVLTALVAERLGCRTNGGEAQRKAKDKQATLAALSVPLPDLMDSHQPNPATLVTPFVLLAQAEDVFGPAAAAIRYPAVLKPLFGSSAVGIRVVRDAEEACVEAGRLLQLLAGADEANELYSLCGFSFRGDNGVMLVEYADGTEHDVDLLLFDGTLVDAVVTDNAPTMEPLCVETVALMPSRLDAPRQQQLVAAAVQACRVLGLRDGALNVELKLGSTGPKVLDVNARMGGFYIPVWIRALWGLDLPAAAFMIACDIRPVGRVVQQAQGAFAGVQLYPGDGHARARVAAADPLWVSYAAPGGPEVGGEYPESIGNVAFRRATPDEAVAVLRAQLPTLYADHPAQGAALVAALDRMP